MDNSRLTSSSAFVTPRYQSVFLFVQNHGVALFRVVTAVLVLLTILAFVMRPRAYPHLWIGDGLYYAAQLRTLVIDRNFDMADEYAYFAEHGYIGLYSPTETTTTGLATNIFEIGPALLWSPFYLATLGGMKLLQPGTELTGYELPLQASLLFASGIYGILAIFLTQRLIHEQLGARRTYAFLAVLVMWLGTSAVYYHLFEGTYAHTVSWFCMALLLTVWVGLPKAPVRRWVLWGGVSGMTIISYWALVPTVVTFWVGTALSTRIPLQTAALRYSAAVVTALAVLAPQFWAWHLLYGGYSPPARAGGAYDFISPHMLEVLFSPHNGLFSWAPITLLGTIGLILLVRSDFRWSASLVAGFLAFVWAAGIPEDWFGAAGFGPRRFIPLTPILAVGFAYLLRVSHWKLACVLIACAAVLVFLNFLLLALWASNCLTDAVFQSHAGLFMSRITFIGSLLSGRWCLPLSPV